MNEQIIIQRMRWLFLTAAAILAVIGYGWARVGEWSYATPPIALSVACALCALGMWLGTKRTIAIAVVATTAIVGGAIASRADPVQPSEAHTISCGWYPDTYLGRIQRATCQYNQMMHAYWHIEQHRLWIQQQLGGQIRPSMFGPD